jgi:hypothetical protein
MPLRPNDGLRSQNHERQLNRDSHSQANLESMWQKRHLGQKLVLKSKANFARWLSKRLNFKGILPVDNMRSNRLGHRKNQRVASCGVFHR